MEALHKHVKGHAASAHALQPRLVFTAGGGRFFFGHEQGLKTSQPTKKRGQGGWSPGRLPFLGPKSEPSRSVHKHACAGWLRSRAAHKHQSAEEHSQVYYYDCTTTCVDKKKCCCSETLRRPSLCRSMLRRQQILRAYCSCFLTELTARVTNDLPIINTKVVR
jgi:hypothetical protein